MLLEIASGHARIAGDLRAAGETMLLALARGDDTLANFGGRLAGAVAGNFAEFHGGNFDMHIDAVEKRTGNFAEIILNFARRAAGFAGHFSGWCGIHRGDEEEFGGKGHGTGGARNGDAAFFEGLPKGFEDVTFEFRKLVEKEDAVVRNGNFARSWVDVSAEE